MGRGRIAGAPTPDIWGRKAGRGRRLQAYGYAPGVWVRGRVAGGPTPTAASKGEKNGPGAPPYMSGVGAPATRPRTVARA
eukprot:gene21561-biopygen2670